jgi:hypothetical protein
MYPLGCWLGFDNADAAKLMRGPRWEHLGEQRGERGRLNDFGGKSFGMGIVFVSSSVHSCRSGHHLGNAMLNEAAQWRMAQVLRARASVCALLYLSDGTGNLHCRCRFRFTGGIPRDKCVHVTSCGCGLTFSLCVGMNSFFRSQLFINDRSMMPMTHAPTVGR